MKDIAIESCTDESTKAIIKGINQYNLDKVPAVADTWTPLNYVVRDNNGAEIAGVLSGIGYWNGLEIKILWVKEEYRGRGLGTKVLRHVENIAIQKGATISMLDTFDFQAEEFYTKNGYEVIGEIKDFPPGHRRIYLSKKLK